MTPLLAVTTQQKVGIAVVVVIGVGWLVYILSTTRRTAEPGSEVELLKCRSVRRHQRLGRSGLIGARTNR